MDCPACSEHVPASYAFCPGCGRSVLASSSRNLLQHPFAPYVMGLAALVGVLVVVGIVVLVNAGGAGDNNSAVAVSAASTVQSVVTRTATATATPSATPTPQPACVVPDFIGVEANAAAVTATSLGFTLVRGSDYHESVPVGAVAFQVPAAGEVRDPCGGALRLVASLGSKPTPTPPPPPTPTPPPPPPPPATLYQANWSGGMAGWTAAFGWSVLDGMLINSGGFADRSGATISPYRPRMRDYAVEAEFQHINAGCTSGYGFVLRQPETKKGIWVGFYVECDGAAWVTLDGIPYTTGATHVKSAGMKLDNRWHTFRAVVQSNTIRFYVDGNLVVEATDNRYLTPGSVGIWVWQTQVSVRNFRITEP